MGKIVSIANQKGGVGKTMTSVSLSACLGLHGKKVLLVDLDPQGHSTKAFGYRDKNKYQMTIRDVIFHVIQDEPINRDELIIHTNENVDLIPSNISLAGISNVLDRTMCRETVLKRFLDTIKKDYDYIIIDTNPSLDILPINALTASDGVLITVQAEPYAVEGMQDLIGTIGKVKYNLNSKLRIEGILITMTDGRTNLSHQIETQIRETIGNQIRIFNNTIPRCTRAAESTGAGRSIFQYDPSGRATIAYNKFTEEEFLNGERNHRRNRSSNVR